MRKALTDKTIQALKPRKGVYDIHDMHCPGLTVRVFESGLRSFALRYRYGTKQRRYGLGRYPVVSLVKAREKAIEALRQVEEGIDPSRRRRQPDMQVEAICAAFIRQYAKPRNRNWRETERILDREFVAVHGQRDIRQIKRHDVLEIMDAALERGASYQANRILATIRKLFNWCLERGIIDATPIAGLKAPTRELSRDRVLDDGEIRRVLNAARLDAYPFRQFVPLLLATAQRRGELANMRWSELDLEARTWVIPAERAKNGKPHVVHLSDFAVSLLDEVPQFVDCDFVFTTTRRSPVSGFSKALRWLHKHSETSDWHMHDLRRTAASGMARAGVAPYVIEKVLNHVSGTISGVAAVYNRYGYDAERCAALEKWGAGLAELSHGE
ncbi:site-specific recombinase XerD [Hephaestia caeni]|uniref:Site-specific recombinase XerD n=1 Tax=Hephaestia caeni TaxID=645617 RepID=A0A397PHC4_9SPHN|nr:site-specific integrase [Hephaestia caeni]RIA46567.1 site-specific recombinase XerD [Hephaestia caeni]